LAFLSLNLAVTLELNEVSRILVILEEGVSSVYEGAKISERCNLFMHKCATIVNDLPHILFLFFCSGVYTFDNAWDRHPVRAASELYVYIREFIYSPEQAFYLCLTNNAEMVL
jgi:hypothetical protein